MDLDNQKVVLRCSTIIPGELFAVLLTITIILITMVLKFLGISILWMWFADSLAMLVFLQILHGAPHGAGEFTLLPIIWSCSGNESNILECGSVLVNSSHCEAATIVCESIDSKSMHNLFISFLLYILCPKFNNYSFTIIACERLINVTV